jgi:hypothetical protein
LLIFNFYIYIYFIASRAIYKVNKIILLKVKFRSIALYLDLVYAIYTLYNLVILFSSSIKNKNINIINEVNYAYIVVLLISITVPRRVYIDGRSIYLVIKNPFV